MRNYSDEIDEIRRLDPIDGTRLTDSWSNSDAKRALFLELTAARIHSDAFLEPTTRRRRVSPRVLAVAASLAIAGVGIVVASGIIQRTSTPAFAIRELPNGVIEIENVADIDDASGLEAELREFGIDAEIVTQPASPSLVGQAHAHAPGLNDDTDGAVEGLTFGKDGTRHVFRWRIDPHAFDDKIVITLFVEPQEGEPYLHATEAFASGEVLGGLHCALGTPVRAADVAARLPELGLTAEWFILSGFEGDATGGTVHSEQVAEVPDGEVVSSQPLDPDTVSFEVVPDGVTAPEWHGSPISDIPCTDGQAARWR